MEIHNPYFPESTKKDAKEKILFSISQVLHFKPIAQIPWSIDSLNLITPLPLYRQLKMKIIEIPDNKECEDLVDDSIQLISKIMPNSILKNLQAPKRSAETSYWKSFIK